MITFRQLEIFVGVVRQGSFRRCAEELSISQVSVSEHVRALEERVGTPLFERRAGGPVALTAAGRRAEHRAADLLGEMRDFVTDVAHDGPDPQRSRKITMHAFMLRDTQEEIGRTLASHPDWSVTTETDEGDIPRLIERTERREVDLGYVYCIDEHDLPYSRLVAYEPLAIFTAADHPLAKRGVIDPSELRDVPALHLASRLPLRGLIDRALAHVGAGNGKVGLETEEFGLILSGLHRRLGFVCMFHASRDEIGQTVGLVEIPLLRPLPPLEIRSIARRGARRDDVLQLLDEKITRETRAARKQG